MTLSALCALFPRIFGTRYRDATTYFTSLFGYPHLMRGEHIIGYALIAEWWYTKSERAQLCSILSLRLCQAKNPKMKISTKPAVTARANSGLRAPVEGSIIPVMSSES